MQHQTHAGHRPKSIGHSRAVRSKKNPATVTVSGCALAALAVLSLAACKGFPGGPQSDPTTANVTVSHAIPATSDFYGCKGTASWELTPVKLTGAEGDGVQKSWGTNFDVSPSLDTSFGPQGHACVVTDTTQFALRSGEWKFTTVIGNYVGVCEVNLHNGWNTLSYHEVKKCSEI